jgi:prepilin-type N-terminal cleavage/methylation domain-containing protein
MYPTARPRRTSPGFSLIEVVIAMAVTTVLLGAAVSVYVRSFGLLQAGQQDAGTIASSRNALDQMLEIMRDAGGVVASQTISGTTYTSGANSVVLKLPSPRTAPGPPPYTDMRMNCYDYVAFWVSNGALCQRALPYDASDLRGFPPDDPPGSGNYPITTVIPKGVSSLAIAYYDSKDAVTTSWAGVARIRVTITMSRGSGAGPLADGEYITFRNYGLLTGG